MSVFTSQNSLKFCTCLKEGKTNENINSFNVSRDYLAISNIFAIWKTFLMPQNLLRNETVWNVWKSGNCTRKKCGLRHSNISVRLPMAEWLNWLILSEEKHLYGRGNLEDALSISLQKNTKWIVNSQPSSVLYYQLNIFQRSRIFKRWYKIIFWE